MMKACVTRVWLPAILLAGLLLGTPADKLLAQPSGATAPPAPSATKTSVDSRKTQLARAAKLADVGKYSAAMAIYRQLFGTHPPPGEVAVAYYETEAATDGGRPQAEQGLRALVEKYPAETRYQVSLGRVLIYDPATRAEGRAYLAKFPDDPQAEQAMRESLLWDAANPAVAPQIRAYLAAHPDPQLVAVFQVAQPEAAKAGTIVTPGNTSTAAAETGQPSSERIVVTPASSRAAAADSQASATQTASVSGISSAPPTAGSPGASADTLPTAPTPAKKPAASPSIAAGPSPVAAPLPMSVEAKPIATSSPRASASAPASAPIRLVSPGTEKPGVPAGGETAAEVAAYQALNANRIDEAESRFQAILSAEPRNEKALAGMGYVRMQQGKFPGAIEYLEQAKQSDATGSIPDKGLQGALDTARFWFGMGEAQKAFAAGDLTTAEKGYRKALAVRPDNPEALEGLGGTLVKAQQPGPAIALYQHATELEPASVDGWRGLFVAQFRNDQVTAALATFQLMPAAVRAQLKGDPGFLGPLASAYAAVGKTGEAQATLQDALKLPFAADQNGLKVEIQTQLAGLLSSANHLDEAVAMYKQVVSEDPGNAGAWESLARLQYAMGQDEEALETIERMPGPAYATAMHAPDFEVTVASIYERMKKLDKAQSVLQQAVTDETNAGQRPSAAIEMQLADIYAERGSPQLAYPVYQQVLRENPERADAWAGLLSALHVTGHDKEAVAQVALIPAGARGQLETNQSYLQTMAAVYARVGQTQQASQVQGRVAQENAVRHDAPAADAEIRRAWLLYNGLDDAGLYAQLMSLGGRTDLTADERRTVETIWTNWAGRRASQASAAGNTRRAVAILNAAARSFPDNPESIKLLAAAYLEAGQPHQAVLIYKEQNMASATASEYEGALSAALADGDSKDAGIWLGYAVAKFPADPQILILAARYEQARGDTARAVQYYRSSLQAMPPVNSGSKLAPELGLPATSAPMILPSAARPQDLSVLLAPGYIESPRMGDQPYLPDGSHSTGLPPYDGTTQLVPPFMTKPDGTKNGTGAEVNAAAEAAAAGQDASVHARNETAATAVAAQSQSPPDAEVYSAYVPYVAPPMRPTREIGSQPGPQSAVTVQLGNDTPQSVQAQTEVTDVLPTAHYGPSAKANQAAASREQAAAARAERIRRLREEGAAERSGQSHPAPDGTAGGMQDAQYTQPQIARPASPPAGYGAVPDTGAQQYPQPRTPPGSDRPGSDRVVIARSRPAPQPSAASSSPAPVQNSPVTQSAPALLAGAAVPSAPSNVSPVTAPGVPSSATQGVPTASPQPAAHSVPANAEVRANPVPPPEGMYSSQAPMPPIQRQQAEDELAALEGSYSGWLGGTGIARYRNGTAGLDRLYDLESPAEASLVVSRKVRITAIAEPVFLNSGTLNPADFSGVNVPYLGTLALDAANLPPRQFFNGVGGELQLAAKSFAVAAGYAPYEFPVRNVTGRFLWNAIGNHVALFGDRQPVKDTLLSYVGLHDPGSASPLSQSPVWGGVIATTGGLRLQFGNRAASFFVSGEGGVLTGRHVLDNYRFKGATGADFRIKNWPNAGELRLGATVSGMHYQHDEVGLTYGQGGYFSPDTYFLGAIPVSFQGHYKANFHYTIAGSVGAQAIQQNAAPFFPLDPGLQNSLVAAQGGACIGALTQTYACGEYPQAANMQFSYSFKSEASYRLADHWYGGGFASANNSSNFQAVSAGFFLRYVFRPQHSQEGYPAGVFHVDGLRPLQIP